MMRIFDSIHDGQPVKIFSTDAELTVSEDRILVGYPIVYNVMSLPDGKGVRAKLLPGSAKFSEQTFALQDHDFKKIIGSTANNTLSITHDERGERVQIGPLPNTTAGNDTYTLVKDKFITGMSFMMKQWQSQMTRIDGQVVEVFSSYMVPEVTVTGAPRFPQAGVQVKDSNRSTYDMNIVLRERAKLHRARLDMAYKV